MSDYKHGDPRNAKTAARCLKEVLPRARAIANTRPGGRLNPVNEVSRSTFPYLRIDNLKGVHVYPTSLGGWSADVEIKDAPLGVPRIVGIPAAYPARTRKEALEQITQFIVILMEVEKANPQTEPSTKDDVRWFELYDRSIPVPAQLVEAMAIGEAASFSDDAIHTLLEGMVDDEFGGAEHLSQDAYAQLPMSNKLMILKALAIALAKGIFRHPPRMEATPSGHYDTPGLKH